MKPAMLRLAGSLMLGFGLSALLYVAGSLTYAEAVQRYVEWSLQRPGTDLEGSPGDDAPDRTSIATRRPSLGRGDPVGQLEIPRLGISVAVLHGVESATLKIGAGHVPGTPLPGAEGNSAIAAHRDTYFRKLEGIRSGDVVRVSTKNRTDEFVVDWTEIVGPEDTRVLETHRAGSQLTLITCYPFYFVGAAPERFVVRASRVVRLDRGGQDSGSSEVLAGP